MLIIYLLSLFLILVIGNNKIFIIKNNSLFNWYFFCVSLYVVPPLIDDLNKNINYNNIQFFIIYTILANLFFLLGYLLCNYNKITKYQSVTNKKLKLVNNLFVIKLFSYSLIIIFLWSFFNNIGNFDNLFSAYLVGEKNSDSNYFQKIILVTSSILSCVFIVNFLYLKNKYIYIFSYMISILFILRGNRNLLAICFLPYLIYLFNTKRIKPFYLTFIFIFFISIGQLLDLIRAIGFNNLDNLKVNFIPSEGEFGQTIRGIDLYFSSYHNYLLLGRTYSFDVISNFLTTFGYSFIPLSTITSTLWSDNIIYGYGFSHQLESYINFNIFGIFIYLIFGSIVAIIDNLRHSTKISSLSLHYLFYPFLLNFQRIDFPVLLKIFMPAFLFIFIIKFFEKYKLKF